MLSDHRMDNNVILISGLYMVLLPYPFTSCDVKMDERWQRVMTLILCKMLRRGILLKNVVFYLNFWFKTLITKRLITKRNTRNCFITSENMKKFYILQMWQTQLSQNVTDNCNLSKVLFSNFCFIWSLWSHTLWRDQLLIWQLDVCISYNRASLMACNGISHRSQECLSLLF